MDAPFGRQPMKTATCLSAAILLLALRASAQNYSIPWFTLDAGGGTSTGVVYSVSGTIGQHDAGTANGGGFTLVGGFWGIVAAVQTAGAPTLEVSRSNGIVTVRWPQPAVGWTLQSATSLSSGSVRWAEISPPYQTNGTSSIFFTEPAPAGNRFYRLHRP